MSIGAYIGVGGKARKVKNIYVGVGDVARSIRRVYIGGADGKARLCWSNGELAYAGYKQFNGRRWLAGTSGSNYAIFGGGYANSTVLSTVEAFDTGLTIKTPENLNTARCYLGAASAGNYAIFAGGTTNTDYTGVTNVVEAYDDTTLTRATVTIESLQKGRMNMASVSVGNYALFFGGITDENTAVKSGDVYNSSLIHSKLDSLYSACRAAATRVGNVAILAGGYGSGWRSEANRFDTSLTTITAEGANALSVARDMLMATSVGNYALFAGGRTAKNTYSNVVDAYNSSGTRTTITPLSVVRANGGATSVGNYAVFCGGIANDGYYSSVVENYDTSLTRKVDISIINGKGYMGSATVGDYALFAGGSCTINNETFITTKVESYYAG